MDEDQPQGGPMLHADLVTGVVLSGLGLAAFWLSLTMPRLENRGIPPLTAPGLVPGILGGLLAACGVILALRSLPALRSATGWRRFGAIFVSDAAARVAVVVALAFGYALGLVGLLPFWLATALFVFAFIGIFEAGLTETRPPLKRLMFAAGLQAVLVGVVVVLVFERGFLVRLP